MKAWVTTLSILVVAGGAIVAAILFARSTSDMSPSNTNTSDQMQVPVFFGNEKLNPGVQDCAAVYPIQRNVAPADRPTNAIRELFTGPTASEKADGYISQFSSATAASVRSLKIINGTAYLNIQDLRSIIPNASASCASANLLAEIETTLRQFPEILHVVVAINGQPRDFYEWLQLECPAASSECDPEPFN